MVFFVAGVPVAVSLLLILYYFLALNSRTPLLREHVTSTTAKPTFPPLFTIPPELQNAIFPHITIPPFLGDVIPGLGLPPGGVPGLPDISAGLPGLLPGLGLPPGWPTGLALAPGLVPGLALPPGLLPGQSLPPGWLPGQALPPSLLSGQALPPGWLPGQALPPGSPQGFQFPPGYTPGQGPQNIPVPVTKEPIKQEMPVIESPFMKKEAPGPRDFHLGKLHYHNSELYGESYDPDRKQRHPQGAPPPKAFYGSLNPPHHPFKHQ